MAKTKLKRMDRFELLELIYNMRKANLDLTERLEAAEKKIEEMKIEAEQRLLDVRTEYAQRMDNLRMHSATQDLQKRMSELEDQLFMFQQITTGKETLSANQETSGAREEASASVFTPPGHDEDFPKPEAVQNDNAAETEGTSQENSDAPGMSDSETGESRE